MTALPWRVKKWDGSQWSTDMDVRRWNGSNLTACNVYYWDGSDWVLMTDRTAPTATAVNEYYSEFEWNQSYKGDNTKRNDGDGNFYNFQGFTSSDSSFGRQRSMWGLPETVFSDFTGAVEFYWAMASIANIHTWHAAGGTAVIGTHAVHPNEPSTFSEFRTELVTAHFDHGETRWVDLPLSVMQDVADGNMYGLTLHAESNSSEYYGYYDGRFTYRHSYETVV